MASWYAELEGKIFTRIKYELAQKSGAKYPSLNCTTTSRAESPTQFPTMYLHELQPVEIGADLVGKTVNAVQETIEIQVYSNQSEKECKTIISDAIDEMKQMSFTVTMFPQTLTRSDRVCVSTARLRRLIGSGDIL